MLNKLVNYNKYDIYYSPTEDELVKGFHFQRVELVKTEFYEGTKCKKITIYWKDRFIEDSGEYSKESISRLLETGYIRCIKDDTLVYIKVNSKNGSMVGFDWQYPKIFIWTYWSYKCDLKKYGSKEIEFIDIVDTKLLKMKFYNFYVSRCEIIDSEYGKYISNKKYNYGLHKERPIRQIIVPGIGIYNKDQAELLILKKLSSFSMADKEDRQYIKCLRTILKLHSKEGYTLWHGGCEHTIEDNWLRYSGPFDHITSLDQIYILGEEEEYISHPLAYDTYIAGMENISGKLMRQKLLKEMVNAGILKANLPETMQEQKEEIKEESRVNKKKFRLSFMKDVMFYLTMRKKLVPISIPEVIDTISKYPTRDKGINKGWEPLKTSQSKQVPKSENRLVYISNKDKTKVKRLTWKWANWLIEKTKEANTYQFLSKEEAKKLLRPTPGKALIPDNIDRKYKRISIQEVVKGQDIIHGTPFIIDDEKVYPAITYKDNPKKDKLQWKNKFVLDEKAKDKYHKYPKTIQNQSSTPKTNTPKKGSGNGTQQYRPKKTINLYEVEVEHKVLDGSGHITCSYQIIAENEESAKSRGKAKCIKENKLNALKSPILRAAVKRSIQSDLNGRLKKYNSTMPHFIPLIRFIEYKDKDGKVKETATVKTFNIIRPIKPTAINKPKKWKCPMTTPSKKYLKLLETKKLLEAKERKKAIEKVLVPSIKRPNSVVKKKEAIMA
jgi:hypothetical protein